MSFFFSLIHGFSLVSILAFYSFVRLFFLHLIQTSHSYSQIFFMCIYFFVTNFFTRDSSMLMYFSFFFFFFTNNPIFLHDYFFFYRINLFSWTFFQDVNFSCLFNTHDYLLLMQVVRKAISIFYDSRSRNCTSDLIAPLVAA